MIYSLFSSVKFQNERMALQKSLKMVIAFSFLILTLPGHTLLAESHYKKVATKSSYKGWDHLALKLIDDGYSEKEVKMIFQSDSIPKFSTVTFRMEAIESPDIYAGFASAKNIRAAVNFATKYKTALKNAELEFGASKYAIVAILLVETGFGNNTGKNPILSRLARLANICDENNIDLNYLILRKNHPYIKREEVFNRAIDIHSMFYPEIKAILQIADMHGISPYAVKGSSAGAYGIPQFLPSSYLKYGVDGNKDGKISLYNMNDAIFSVGNYLASYGWQPGSYKKEKKEAIWHYNHSAPYVETVYKIYKKLKELQP